MYGSGSSSPTASLPTRQRTGARCSPGIRATRSHCRPRRTLRVLGVRDDDADQPPALVVEDLPGSATSDVA